MLRWLWLSLGVVVLDQVTKYAVEASFQQWETLPLIPFLNLTLTYNEGAAFSFLADAGGWQRWFFVVLACAVIAVLVGWLYRLQQEARWLALALALIIGGAVGNLIDRILLGKVVDFIDFYIGQWHWPAFNVADSAISVGVVILLLDALVFQSQNGNASLTGKSKNNNLSR